ncbi:ras gtpase [Anaeramoeba ignava]|uniref:Ras gtpase n=1 Tax=Anaeramoeba ignava TaxID=1746090 RepID=A0A9Q0LBV1_ANAIG|nr:ras gtpase [Anaeramoeba ignava]
MDDKELKVKVCIFGAGGVGKSSIVTKFIDERFLPEYDPTIEDFFRKRITLNDEQINFSIIDTAGNEEYSLIIENWIKESNIFVLVYSITRKLSLKEVQFFHDKIQRFFDCENYPKVLIGNKSDLFTKREVSIEKGKKLAKELNCKFIETSAKTGENINQIFYETILLEIERLKTIENQKENQNNQNQKKKKKGKCLLM